MNRYLYKKSSESIRISDRKNLAVCLQIKGYTCYIVLYGFYMSKFIAREGIQIQ